MRCRTAQGDDRRHRGYLAGRRQGSGKEAGRPLLVGVLLSLAQLGAPVKKLVIVPGASHLFEEPGTLEEVARLAADWFTRYLDLPAEARAD